MRTTTKQSYESPRLKTYGKLQELTKGTGTSQLDNDSTQSKV